MRRALTGLFGILLTVAGLVGCGRPATPDHAQQAAAEATSIIEDAQATAVVLRARMTAAALVQPPPLIAATAPPLAVAPQTVSAPLAAGALPVVTSTPLPGATLTPSTASAPAASSAGEAAMSTSVPNQTSAATDDTGPAVHLTSVMANDDFIIINFLASYHFVDSLTTPGRAYVVNETDQIKYDSIPFVPLMGPMVGRPAKGGHVAYIMLNNIGRGVKPGSVVTVVLGDFKQEHITVSGS